MTPHFLPAVSARHRAVARWTTTVLALALLTGCSPTTGGGSAPSTPGTASVGSSAPAEPTTDTTPPPTVNPAPATPSPTGTPVPEAAPASGAGAALAGLTVAASGTMSDYDRDAQFGEWIDADGDCADTRQEVLARDLEQVVSSDGCTVETGVLDPDPYTGATIEFTRGVATSSDVQIDHVVAAGNAWISGARGLSPEQRVAFYNDPLNLLAVDGPTNGAKSDSAAHEWLPPNTDFHCDYVAIQVAVKAKYELSVTAPEKTAMTEVLTDCPDQKLPEGEPFGDLTASSGVDAGAGAAGDAPAPEAPAVQPDPVAPAPAPVAPAPPPAVEAPAPAAPAAPAGGYANCAAARAAGAAPLYVGSPGYAAKLDRDGDGVACEN